MTNRELDAEIAMSVMGWTHCGPGFDTMAGKPPLARNFEPNLLGVGKAEGYHGLVYEVPHYTTDPAADCSVLAFVRETWGNYGCSEEYRKLWEAFHWAVWQIWIERRKDGWQRTVDFLAQYQPGDYSRAALSALGIEVNDAE